MNTILQKSEVWKEEVNQGMKEIVKVVAKRGPNLTDKLFKRKRLALGNFCKGGTLPCLKKQCMCCQMVAKKEQISIKGKIATSAGGNCSSNNVVYAIQCKLCKIAYVGKTVQKLRDRITGHRKAFYATSKNAENVSSLQKDDTNILGIHLVNSHQKSARNDFNSLYEVSILQKDISPSRIRIVEQMHIDKFNTLAPFGLNQNSSLDSF